MEKKTNSHSKAVKKYNAKTYKNLQAQIKISDWEMIDTYCKSNKVSKASLITAAVRYYIENDIKNKE